MATPFADRWKGRRPVLIDVGMEPLRIRPATPADLDAVLAQFVALWPKDPPAEHRAHAAPVLAGTPPSSLPLTILVAERNGVIIGFAEVGLRSHADGCDGRQAVGFLEGWFVVAEERRRGVGAALVRAAEDWARGHGCREMASDTWLDNEASEKAHRALGYEVADRVINFRKSL
jgi:aminoglycoside 6'-N-acetyltransferase I